MMLAALQDPRERQCWIGTAFTFFSPSRGAPCYRPPPYGARHPIHRQPRPGLATGRFRGRASSQLLTNHLLAPALAALHARHRGILIEALPDPPGEPLATQDADVCVRLRRFEHPELVVRNLGGVAFGFYGSAAYLSRYGEPDLGSRRGRLSGEIARPLCRTICVLR